jgi:chloramphenicol O-acetyltransferase
VIILSDQIEKEARLNTAFYPIDFDHWDRKPYFYYFSKMLPTAYSISVEVEINNTYDLIKKQNKKFFPAYLYVASRLIAEQEEFRIGNLDEQLGYYEVLHPSYACFHEDDKTMSNMWTEYHPSFEIFHQNYMEDQRNYAENHGILAKPDMPPQNSYMIGMLPWISFTHYSPIPFANLNHYFPVLEAGKFFNRGDKKIMPFSFTIHHAVADGYHVGRFLEKFQAYMDHPEDWMC